MINSNKYTTRQYWEKFYSKSVVEPDAIRAVCSKYDPIWEFMVTSCINSPKTIIEIGAYPGRYLAYLSSRFNLIPTALDYNSDQTKIQESFYSMGIENYSLLHEDFTTFNPTQKYDIVISLGFIEHFGNFEEIMDRHMPYVNDGGVLLIEIPNKRYLKKWFSYLCDYNNLKAHNLKCMKKKVFQEFAKRNNLKINLIEYNGGFTYGVHQPLNFFQKIVYHGFRKIFKKINPILEKHPSKYYSHMLFGIFSK